MQRLHLRTQLENLKELSLGYYSKVRQCMKPWSEFGNIRTMSKPQSAGEAGHRVYVNVFKYQGNYLCLVLLLFVYSVATNPYLLFGIGLGFFSHIYFATKRNPHDGSVKIAGKFTIWSHKSPQSDPNARVVPLFQGVN